LLPSSHSSDQTRDFADLALKRIEAYGLLPTPENFELWFVYFAGSDPDVMHNVDELLRGGVDSLDAAQCYEIYSTFLSGADGEKVVEEAGHQIQKTIDDVNVAVTSARSSAADYTETLKNKKDEIKGQPSAENVGGLLDSVLADTEKMISHHDYLEEMLEHSARAMEDMRRDLEVARREALTDPLTGLANRKAFDQELERFMTKVQEDEHYAFSMILMDIDHFKGFNDNFGHQIGDQVLKLVARTLRESVKGRDVTVRYGGEEFAVLLPETNIYGASKIADILRKEVEKKDVVNRSTGKQIAKITLSAGVSQYIKGEDREALIGRVDTALYDAKNAGRNRVETIAVAQAS